MTAAIAIYGALFSTVAFMWQVYTWIKNRYRLALSVHCQEIYPNGIESPPRVEIVFRIVNIGREPVTLISYGWECDRARVPEKPGPISYEARDGTDSKGKPVVLRQAEWHEYRLPQCALDVGRLRGWAKDANGKPFTSAWYDRETREA